jgi:hypothetical protein
MVRAVVTALTVFAGTALADDWKEYKNRDYSFTVHFPADPMVEIATYQAADGRSFSAHVFSVRQKTAEFKITVVDIAGRKSWPRVTARSSSTLCIAFALALVGC